MTSIPVETRTASLAQQGVYGYFDLPFLADLPVEALVIILWVPCQVKLHPHHGFPDPIPTQPGSVSILFCPCSHHLCSSFLPSTFTSKSWLSNGVLFPSLPDFLLLGIKSSCALWKPSLKMCQLCSTPLSLRAVSLGFLLVNSLKSWNYAFLKFRVLTLLFAWPLSLRSVNTTSTWSLQPRLTPILMSLISSFALVTSIAFTFVGLSITWLKKLS